MDNKWVDAMIELNNALEEAKEAGVTKMEVMNEVKNVYEE